MTISLPQPKFTSSLHAAYRLGLLGPGLACIVHRADERGVSAGASRGTSSIPQLLSNW